MRFILLSVSLAMAASSALAQNCFDRNYGTLISTNQADVVLAIQPIGFPFSIGGVTYTDIHITDHGYLQFSNAGVPVPVGGAALWTPTVATFSAGSPKVACLHGDIVGSGGGTIYINSSATKCVVTWISMQNYGIPAPRFDFQCTLYPNGDVRCTYGPGCINNSTFGGVSDNGIAGITPGGGVVLPAATDLSAGGVTVDPSVYEVWATALTFDLGNNSVLFIATAPGYVVVPGGPPANCAARSNYGSGCDGLSMTSVGYPAIGNPSYALAISGIPVVSPVAFVAFGGVVNPGLNLTFIGMGGCFANQDLTVGLFSSGPVVGGASSFALAIPNNVSLAGSVLGAQAVSLSLATSLGLAASNGTQINVGF